ncbi:MAG: DUF7305 domain-containing protein [Planctomycetota bacterium]|jgi:hypothetical protein
MEKQQKNRLPRKLKGSILALAVLLVVLLAILGLVMIRLGSNARVQAARGASDIAARAAADAGLTQAIRMMNMKLIAERVWDNSNLPSASDVALPNTSATFSFGVKGDKASGFQVTSTGKAGFSERTVHSRLSVESLWFGIGVKQDVSVMTKTTFETLPEGSDFTIRTNSIADNAIKLYAGTAIPGDVIVGPGGDPDTAVNSKASTTITGDVYAADEEIEFPDVIVPELEYKGSLPAPVPGDPNLIELNSTHSGIYDEINLGQGQKLNIIGGEVTIYVTGDVRLHQGSELLVLNNTSAPALNLYLGGNLQADQGSLIVTQEHIEEGTRLKIYGTNDCTSVVLMNSGDLSAAIYAPYADMQLKNSGDIYGAFTGNNLEMKNSGRLVFDTRLLDLGMDDDLTYMVQRWWEE